MVIVTQFIGNHLIEDHDAGVFLSPKSDTEYSLADELIQETLGGFLRWDAQYFTHIAKYGYTYENTLAFFPLYPMLTAMFSHFLGFIFPFLNIESTVLLAGIVLNFIIFVLAALSLYRLTKLVLHKENLAFKAALFFCFNPATIFFSAPYTETLFAYLTFIGLADVVRLYKSYLSQKKTFHYTDIFCLIPLSASTCTRSNGILNIGFLLYFFINFHYYKVVFCNTSIKHYFILSTVVLAASAFSVVLCITPFNVYQVYAYNLFCMNYNNAFPENVLTYAVQNNLILSGRFSQHNQSWCYQSVPFSYSYIQEYYWNVGFLRYYTFKQIPNFALALPITYLILKCSYEFFKLHPFVIYYPFANNGTAKKFFPKSAFVFVVHASFLAVFNFLYIHVQVSTRILCSASPVLYWYCAFVFKDVPASELLKFRSNVKLSRLQCFIKYYFITYFTLGTILFCNFLPWT